MIISGTSCLGLPTVSLGSLLKVETVIVSTSQDAHEDLIIEDPEYMLGFFPSQAGLSQQSNTLSL